MFDTTAKNSIIDTKKSTLPLTDNANDAEIPDYLEIDINDIDFYERCGNGSYGCVYRGTWLSRNREIAIKKLLQLENEANVLSKLSHRNIIKFYGVVSKPPSFCLITEYASNGSLQAFIQNHNLIEEYGFDLILEWAKDIALGVNYLHDEAPVNIIHRDLKSTNVVITQDLICKICDFGTSIYNFKTTKMSLIGTFPWMAPEIIQGKLANEKCDIWSFGVVLWELVTGNLPFKGLESFQIAYLIVERDERLPIPSGCPPILSELMKSCWKTEPKERPHFRQILGTLDQIYNNIVAKEEIDVQLHTNKPNWEEEIKNTFEKLKMIEQVLHTKEKELDERERKLREEEIKLINNFKIITIEDYDVNGWREVDVFEWIKKTGEKVDAEGYAELFLQNNINGETLLKLTKTDLKSMGISSIGHNLYLYDEIQRLKIENARLRNFPPLKIPQSSSKQLSQTKDVTFCACIGSHIIGNVNSDEFSWKMYFDIYDSDESKDNNVLLYIRDVKFVCRNPPFQQFCLTKPPFLMLKWVKSSKAISKVDCIVTFEEKVIKPRTTRIEYDLKENINKTVTQNVTITLQNRGSQELATSSSLQSIGAALISSTNSSVNNTVSDAWKNRTFEDSVQIEPNYETNSADLWSGIVSGKYKNSEHVPYYKHQISANVMTSQVNNSVNAAKYKRCNTVSEIALTNNSVDRNRNNYSNKMSSNKNYSNERFTRNSSNTSNKYNSNSNNNTASYKNKNINNTLRNNTLKKTNGMSSEVFFDIGSGSDDSSRTNSLRSNSDNSKSLTSNRQSQGTIYK